jgi:hypothetical protein
MGAGHRLELRLGRGDTPCVFGRRTTKGLPDFVARTRALRRFRPEHGPAMLSRGRGTEVRGTILLG